MAVLTPGEIPTTDLYLRENLRERFGEAVAYVNTLRTSPNDFVLGSDTLIVVVRYAPKKWLLWLKRRKDILAGIALLIDDDMPTALRAPELPFRYAMKNHVALCTYAAIARSTVQRSVGVHAGTGKTLYPLFSPAIGAELCRIKVGRRGKGRLFLPRHLGPSPGDRMAGTGSQAGSGNNPGFLVRDHGN